MKGKFFGTTWAAAQKKNEVIIYHAKHIVEFTKVYKVWTKTEHESDLKRCESPLTHLCDDRSAKLLEVFLIEEYSRSPQA